jgi:hypothetical protein
MSRVRHGAGLFCISRGKAASVLSSWRPLAISHLNLGSDHYTCGISSTAIWNTSKRWKNAFR